MLLLNLWTTEEFITSPLLKTPSQSQEQRLEIWGYTG